MTKKNGVGCLLVLAMAAVVNMGQTGTNPVGPPAGGVEVQTDHGTFLVPAGFTSKQTGTKDSYKGVAKRQSDGFTVDFDIGFMAGTHMHDKLRPACTYYQEHVINGVPARTGIQVAEGVKTITTTIYDAKANGEPANFWATINADADMADYFVIVATYRPEGK